MATEADVRKIALALEGVSEVDHWGRPSYRTKARIFAVMRPDGLNLNLPEERKAFLFEADPATFVKFMWGKKAVVLVQIAKVSKTELAALIHEAWVHSKPVAKAAPRKTKKVASKRARGAAWRNP